ncbi:MAG TPA: PilT/PilU family type 4a pilus ATPase [Acidimicrobiales bacterium]|jgi:twitching motility protein PilT
MTATTDPDLVNDWIERVWKAGGTDLLLTAEAPPLARVDGHYAPLDGERILAGDDTELMLKSLVAPDAYASFLEHRQIDFSITWQENVRVRGNAFVQRGRVAISLRIIPLQIPTLAELGLPKIAERFAEAPSGLVLLTGPTGAGKSTTLAALIDHVNLRRACHILTIEDPIEYVHSHKRSVVSQREIGIDAESFESALRAALREDPDVILVGEMRDLESIGAALTLAETGHLVFATLHTNDTAQSLDRIVDVFPSDRRDQIQVQLSATLQGVIYQRLLPRVDGGLVGAYEVMVGTNAVKNLVREGKTRQLRNVVATHRDEGMQTLETSLSQLIEDGVITEETAMAVTLHPREITKSRPLAASMDDGGVADAVDIQRRRRLRK